MELYFDPETGLRVAWDPPALASRSVDPPDVSGLPGARIVGSAALGDEMTDLGAGCVRGASDRFVPGLEGVLFDKATWFMLRAADARPIELVTTSSTGDVGRGLVEQLRAGKLDDAEAAVGSLAMHHVLTFVGPDRDVLLCSAICATKAAPTCGDAVASLRVEGDHAPLPEPATWMRSILYTAAHPLVGAGVVASLFVAVVAVLVWRRPRRRRFG